MNLDWQLEGIMMDLFRANKRLSRWRTRLLCAKSRGGQKPKLRAWRRKCEKMVAGFEAEVAALVAQRDSL